MTWAYIAGFFDGEGCVSRSNRMTYHVSMSQSIKQHGVLYLIQDFLSENGIESQIYNNASRQHPCSALMITKQAGVKKFVEETMPFVVVKREKCNLALVEANKSLLRMNKWKESIPKAAEMYERGYSFNDVCAAYSIDQKRLRKYLVLHGMAIRPVGTNQGIGHRKYLNSPLPKEEETTTTSVTATVTEKTTTQ